MPNTYNDSVVRQFVVMTVIWGIVGMAVGLLLAAQLIWPALNFDIPWLTYSRLRPLHTNAVIFAFGGSALFATAYYVVQRTCHARLLSRELAGFTFWGWQLVIVLAAVTLPLGITQSKEYAELEWPIDILIALVWVAFAVVFLGTLARRRIRHIYVANWYYGALIITIAVLHIVNNIAVPVSFTKSYPVYAGVVDAMVQWWYGHNAVGFFLTAGFLGMMYYFVPKQSGRPIWSYRLGVINFWALIAIYMWAGPHHLIYTSLPDWAQTLGVIFSLMLWAPSWGAAVNGLMTVHPEWDKLRNNIALRFMAMSLVFYAIATFEGSITAVKDLNAIGHYTDAVIGHVHGGALGWVAMITIGSLYALIPRLWNTESMYSTVLMRLHFWLSLGGTVLYLLSMWVAGVQQGILWGRFNPDGTLAYTFMDVLNKTMPYYMIRLIGGALFLLGLLLMAYNMARTIMVSRGTVDVAIPEPAR